MPGQGFLPICREDMEKRGIRQFDFVYVIGDAYVDHPSFGHAIISRLLEAYGYTVGIISQPDWRQKESVAIYGEAILLYGMGERSMIHLAEALDSGLAAEDSTFVEGTVCKVRRKEDIYDAVFLPPYASVREDRECYAKSFYTQY